MKIRLLIFIFLFSFVKHSYCQLQTELWGITQFGGQYGQGCIFKTDSNGENQQVKYSFPDFPNHVYNAQFYEDTALILTIATTMGGRYGQGTISVYDIVANTFTIKAYFNPQHDTYWPEGNLIKAPNGRRYGISGGSGSANDYGTIYYYNPATNYLSQAHAFSQTTYGKYPESNFVMTPSGIIYGVTNQGGSQYASGILFEYNTSNNSFIKKKNFEDVNGYSPNGNLVMTSNGMIYGTTTFGGVNYVGNIYSYNPTNNVLTNVFSFEESTSGKSPSRGLFLADNNKFYGSTYQGGMYNTGTFYEYDPATNIFTKIRDIGNSPGNESFYGIMQAANGKLYGFTSGGSNGKGTISEYDINTNTFTIDYNFDSINGYAPGGMLFEASNGKMYALTNAGGICDKGVVFEFDPVTKVYTKKVDLIGDTEGILPANSLMQASNGKLYSTTPNGGLFGGGVIFEYDTETDIYKKLVNATGVQRHGGFVETSNGKLYGLDNYSNGNSWGSIFEYNIPNDSLLNKFLFTSTNTGGSPSDNLVLASNQKLYGLTSHSGLNNYGVLFEYDPITNVFVKKIDFNGMNNGKYPIGSLMQASNGKLYGMCHYGGLFNKGVLFEFNISTDILLKLLDFDSINTGSNPVSELEEGPNGMLYAMTLDGGVNNFGVLFEFNPVNNTFSKKIDFDGLSKGKRPIGSLFKANNNKLYGMTGYGGVNDRGTLFEYDVLTNIFTKKLDFNDFNGCGPSNSHLIEVCLKPKIAQQPVNDTVCLGMAAKFRLSANINISTYQWQVDNGTGFTDLINNSVYQYVNTDSLQINNVTSSMLGLKYRCLITSACPIVSFKTSDTVHFVIVAEPDSISAIIGLSEVCVGQTNVVYSVFPYLGNYQHDWTLSNNVIGTSSCDTIIVNFGFMAQNNVIQVKRINMCGQSNTLQLNVTTQNPPDISLGNDTVICIGDIIYLSPGMGFDSYLWSDNSVNSVLSVFNPGIYTVEVSKSQCKDTATIVISKCNPIVWLPNSFTPNNDGLNDFFEPLSNPELIIEMRIYNRWGNEIYLSSGKNIRWDGCYKGQLCEMGVYSYVIKYQENAEEKSLLGSITLIR